MEKAIELKSAIPGLSLSVDDGGVWFNVRIGDLFSSTNLSIISCQQRKTGSGVALFNWCMKIKEDAIKIKERNDALEEQIEILNRMVESKTPISPQQWVNIGENINHLIK